MLLTGATYYAHPDAAGGGDGSRDLPWSAQEVCARVSAGNEVVFTDGHYRGPVVCNQISGSADAPIRLRAENPGGAVISAAHTVTAWQPLEDNVWLSERILGLSGKGTALWRVGETKPRRLVKSTELDQIGEFAFRAADRRLLLFAEDNPNESDWRAWNVGATGMRIQGVSHYVIDGLRFEYNNVGLLAGCSNCGKPTNHITVKNATSEYATHWAMAAASGPNELTRHVTFDGVSLRYVAGSVPDHRTHNEYCFKFAANMNTADGRHGTIRNSEWHHCNGHGVQASNGWDDITFSNNVCHDVSLARSGAGACMRCGTTAGCTITGNRLYGGDNPQASGIFLQDGAHEVLVADNDIRDFDWHGIYVFATNGEPVYGARIHNNVIADNRQTGIRIEAAAADGGGIRIAGNTFEDNVIGIWLHPKRGDAVEGVAVENNRCDGFEWKCLKAEDGVNVSSAGNEW